MMDGETLQMGEERERENAKNKKTIMMLPVVVITYEDEMQVNLIKLTTWIVMKKRIQKKETSGRDVGKQIMENPRRDEDETHNADHDATALLIKICLGFSSVHITISSPDFHVW